MPFKTILILINIAIICIIACIIVKLYYRDEEKGRKLETHEIESSLKGHNQMPLFKEEHHKKDSRNKINNTISSTKNKYISLLFKYLSIILILSLMVLF